MRGAWPIAGRIAGALTAGLLAGAPLHAEPGVTGLIPEAVEGLASGKIAMAKGMTGAEADRFIVENIGIFRPVAVTVLASRKGDDVRLKLGKYDWTEDYEHGSTSATGRYTAKLRTQGDLMMSVSSPSSGAGYTLLVWIGDEVMPEMTPALVPASQVDNPVPAATQAPTPAPAASTAIPGWVLGLIAVLLVALGFAIAWGMRRRGA